MTVSCPLDCEYLIEARRREKPSLRKPEEWPNQDVQITEEFLRNHEPLLIFLGMKLLEASLETAGAVDSDVRQSIESLIRTYRTLQSGLYYETMPDNLIAAGIHQRIQAAIEQLRKELTEKGATGIRDSEILGILVFLERVALSQDNGRPRGRAFIDYLRGYFADEKSPASASSLIQV